MGYHTFDVARADQLEDLERFADCSLEELLGLMDPSPGDAVLDLGSGTGFYADALAPYVGRTVAADIQPEMCARHRAKNPPANVHPTVASAHDLPVRSGTLDAVVCTFTYHEVGPPALVEASRVLGPGGRLAIVDWTADGSGDRGPPTAERYALHEAEAAARDAGFELLRTEERRETLVLAGRATGAVRGQSQTVPDSG